MTKSFAFSDKKRFKWLEENRINELRHRSLRENIALEKDLINFYEPFRNAYRKDTPVSYKILLRKKNK